MWLTSSKTAAHLNIDYLRHIGLLDFFNKPAHIISSQLLSISCRFEWFFFL